MIEALVLAHLLGDYILQTDGLARWKQRSLAGVVVHGAIVTLMLWLCSVPFDPHWWPYALGLGLLHTLIDLVRARLGSISPGVDLALFLADQVAHGVTIVLALALSGWLTARPALTPLGQWLQADNRLSFLVGYVLLTMPAWVLIHFLTRGMGARQTSLPGRPGERYLGMVERTLIATFMLTGQLLIVPLVVAPRLVLEQRSERAAVEPLAYLNELLISVGVAVVVGLLLRSLL